MVAKYQTAIHLVPYTWILFLILDSAALEASTHYEALGIPEDASRDDIRTAYHRQSLLCHPDKNPNDPNAHAKFIRVGEAYSILRDPDRRAAYDTLIRHNRRRGGSGTSGSSSSAPNDEFSFEFNGMQFSMEELAMLLRTWETERPDLHAAMSRFEEFLGRPKSMKPNEKRKQDFSCY